MDDVAAHAQVELAPARAKQGETDDRAARAEDAREPLGHAQRRRTRAADANDRVPDADACLLSRPRTQQRGDDQPSRRRQHADADPRIRRRRLLAHELVRVRSEIGGVRIVERRDDLVDRAELQHLLRNRTVVLRRERFAYLVDRNRCRRARVVAGHAIADRERHCQGEPGSQRDQETPHGDRASIVPGERRGQARPGGSAGASGRSRPPPAGARHRGAPGR